MSSVSDHEDKRLRDVDDVGGGGNTQSRVVGSEAIKWGAIVIIVLAILWFLAQYVIPLF